MFQGIQDHFRYVEETGLYSMRMQEDGYNLEIPLIRNKDCLAGLSRRSIQKLFGTPSRSDSKGMYYYFTPGCLKNKNGIGFNECTQCVARLDEDGRCREFTISGSMPNIDFIPNDHLPSAE